MGRGSRCALAILFGCLTLLLVILPACGNGDQPDEEIIPTSRPQLSDCPVPCSEALYERYFIVDNRQVVTTTALADECVVEHCPADATTNHPIRLTAYRLRDVECADGHASYPYTLTLPPELDHHCVCTCEVDRHELLSCQPGEELIVQDVCGEETKRLFVYTWVTDTKTYELLGYLYGDRIYADKVDEIAVDSYLSRLELYTRNYYQPCDREEFPFGWRYSQQGDYVFPDGDPPADVLTSPYPPEWVVLAFYHDYPGDADLSGYFAGEACTGLGCGCRATRENLTRVRVSEMDVFERRHSDSRPAGASIFYDRVALIMRLVCEEEDGGRQINETMLWYLEWKPDRGWRMSTEPPWF